MEHIRNITRSIRDSTGYRILASENKRLQIVLADPLQTGFKDVKGGEDPPAVTNIFELLRSAVEAAVGELAEHEPLCELLSTKQILATQNMQGSHAAEY